MRTIEPSEIPIAAQLRQMAIGETCRISPASFRLVKNTLAKKREGAFDLIGPAEDGAGEIRRITHEEAQTIADAKRDEREAAEIAKTAAYVAARDAREAAALSRKRSKAQVVEQKRRRQERADKATRDAMMRNRLGLAPVRRR
jgi:hypothetical protein